MTTLLESNHKYYISREISRDLEDLVQECIRTRCSWGLLENDILFAVAFWSMLECGFEPDCHGESKRIGNKIEGEILALTKTTLPPDWKHTTRKLYEAEFVLPPYAEHRVRLVALPTEDILCINVVASNMSPRSVNLRSLAVNSSGYVPRPDEKRISSKFSGLEEFHLKLRNAIIWPIRCSILTDEGIMNGSLSGLSDEIKLKIVGNLQVKELLILSQTCHDLNRICNDQGLWKRFFKKHFGNYKGISANKVCQDISDWKESYKQIYLMKQMKKISEDSSVDSFHTPQETPYDEFDFDID